MVRSIRLCSVKAPSNELGPSMQPVTRSNGSPEESCGFPRTLLLPPFAAMVGFSRYVLFGAASLQWNGAVRFRLLGPAPPPHLASLASVVNATYLVNVISWRSKQPNAKTAKPWSERTFPRPSFLLPHSMCGTGNPPPFPQPRPQGTSSGAEAKTRQLRFWGRTRESCRLPSVCRHSPAATAGRGGSSIFSKPFFVHMTRLCMRAFWDSRWAPCWQETRQSMDLKSS